MSKTYEDDSAKAQRVLDLKLAGLIDDADARVMLGLSSNRAEAKEYIDEIKGSAAPKTALQSLFAAPTDGAQTMRETTVIDGGDNGGS